MTGAPLRKAPSSATTLAALPAPDVPVSCVAAAVFRESCEELAAQAAAISTQVSQLEGVTLDAVSLKVWSAAQGSGPRADSRLARVVGRGLPVPCASRRNETRQQLVGAGARRCPACLLKDTGPAFAGRACVLAARSMCLQAPDQAPWDGRTCWATARPCTRKTSAGSATSSATCASTDTKWSFLRRSLARRARLAQRR